MDTHRPSSAASVNPRFTPRSWYTLLLIAATILLLVGYYTFNRIADSLEVPEELLPYQTLESTLTRVITKDAPTTDAELMTTANLQLYASSFHVADSQLCLLGYLMDSVAATLKDRNPKSYTQTWRSPQVLRTLTLLPLRVRRELVAFLNANKLSWLQYARLKEWAVASTSITHAELDHAFITRFGNHYFENDTIRLLDTRVSKQLFKRAESMKLPQSRSTSDSITIAALRIVMLKEGVASLLDLESVFE